jgi:hypothetical protein
MINGPAGISAILSDGKSVAVGRDGCPVAGVHAEAVIESNKITNGI